MSHKIFAAKQAFTLVELSVVLVIIGLIIGGISFGSALVRNSQILILSNELNQYKSAIENFVQKYNGLPGDITNASTYWPNCAAAAGDSGVASSCDGNGDGVIGCNPNNASCVASSESTERLRAWQHLSLSGILNYNYSGLSLAGFNLGIDTPISKYPNAGYIFNQDPCYNTGDHYLYISSNSFDNILPPQDASDLDTKIDDGNPMVGNVRASAPESPINGSCSNATTACFNSLNLNYNVNGTLALCLMAFKY